MLPQLDPGKADDTSAATIEPSATATVSAKPGEITNPKAEIVDFRAGRTAGASGGIKGLLLLPRESRRMTLLCLLPKQHPNLAHLFPCRCRLEPMSGEAL